MDDRHETETDLDRAIDAQAGIVEEHTELIQRLLRYMQTLDGLEVQTIVEIDRLKKRTATALAKMHEVRAEYCRTLRTAIEAREACESGDQFDD